MSFTQLLTSFTVIHSQIFESFKFRYIVFPATSWSSPECSFHLGVHVCACVSARARACLYYCRRQYGTTREKKARKTEAEMGELCQPIYERAIGTTKEEVHDRTGWRRIVSLSICRSDPTTKWERLEEGEEVS